MTAPAVSVLDAARLEACLSGDGVAVVPTDTVYGLACNPSSELAVRRMYELKGRLPRKPSAVMFFALASALQALPELAPHTRAALEALLPGPVTLLLPNTAGIFPLASGALQDRAAATAAAAGAAGSHDAAQSRRPRPALGLRVPLFRGALAALAEVAVPALQSSANFSGGPDPRRLSDVPSQLRDGADLLLDGGELAGTASTVIDLTRYEKTRQWRIVRDGPLDSMALVRILDSWEKGPTRRHAYPDSTSN